MIRLRHQWGDHLSPRVRRHELIVQIDGTVLTAGWRQRLKIDSLWQLICVFLTVVDQLLQQIDDLLLGEVLHLDSGQLFHPHDVLLFLSQLGLLFFDSFVLILHLSPELSHLVLQVRHLLVLLLLLVLVDQDLTLDVKIL